MSEAKDILTFLNTADSATRTQAVSLCQKAAEEITALQQRVEELEAALLQWRDISSAPKDGTIIDLWCRRSWEPPATHERRTGVYWCRAHERWRTEGNLHFVEATFTTEQDRHLIPTHWMPLPYPPEQQ